MSGMGGCVVLYTLQGVSCEWVVDSWLACGFVCGNMLPNARQKILMKQCYTVVLSFKLEFLLADGWVLPTESGQVRWLLTFNI